jgi:hypothetical protein
MDELSKNFVFEDCADQYWNPEKYSLLYGTPLWNQASETQKIRLNQIFWVAYYSQIISAEIATIFFNQTSAAGLYGIEDFRIVCDTLDLESMQERAHIQAFKVVGEKFEEKVFGQRIFTYPMRTPYFQTMVHADTNRIKDFWRNLQLRAFTLMSSSNAFIGCQYFTVRGLRTLNGKLVQHKLAQFYKNHPEKEKAPIPSHISYCHFMDESFHFNSSTIISHDVIRSLKEPTRFEKQVINLGIRGTQRDHYHFSSAINGLFWYDPALFSKVYFILRSPVFGMSDGEARLMMDACFAREHEGLQESLKSRDLAIESYQEYLVPLSHITAENAKMSVMRENSLERHLDRNRKGLRNFFHHIEKRELPRVPKLDQVVHA